jgi:hypothetical protein
MTYNIGDPDHVGVHNRLRADTSALALSTGVDVTLPPPRTLGDTGHTDDHNLLTDALAKIAADAKPPTAIATGGTVADVTIDGVVYRVHTFTTDGTLTVERAGQADVFLIGGGAHGDSAGNHVGGPGVVREGTFVLPVGAIPVTVGVSGTATVWDGTTSSLGDIVASGKAYGATWPGAQFPPGAGATDANRLAEYVTTITGSPVGYGLSVQLSPRPNRGDGANTGNGSAGVVIVRYPAPPAPTLLPAPVPDHQPTEVTP